MHGLLLVAACFSSLVFGAISGAQGQEADKPKAGSPAAQLMSAEAALSAERGRLAAATDALEALVVELEGDYIALTSGPDAPARRNSLALALLDSVAAAEARIAALAAQGRSVQRGTRARILREVFADPVAASPVVDARLGAWIADKVATSLSARTRLDDLAVDDILRVIAKLFVPGESWHVFWNRSFREDLPAATAYTEALRGYEVAGLAVDRLRNPERYGPKGEPAPPGMVIVPGGTYHLGPNSGWQRASREVDLDAFAMDRREVTCREYAHFLRDRPASEREALLPGDWTLQGDVPTYPEGHRDHPVAFVSWGQAAAFATALGKRLPTEDEWEAAAAGPDGDAYPWGNAFSVGLTNGAGVSDTTVPVESYPTARSAAGCFDLAGNVWEWTATLEDGTDIKRLPEGLVNVVIRGGSFRSPRHELSTRYRWTSPGQGLSGSSAVDKPIGFRCAQDVD